MDGTLGVAMCGLAMRTTQNLLHGSFHNNLPTLRRLRGGPWKRMAVSCEKIQAPGKRPVLCEQL